MRVTQKNIKTTKIYYVSFKKHTYTENIYIHKNKQTQKSHTGADAGESPGKPGYSLLEARRTLGRIIYMDQLVNPPKKREIFPISLAQL